MGGAAIHFVQIVLIEHRPREIGWTWLWGKLEKLARIEKLENSIIVFQNDVAFLGVELKKQVYPSFPRSID